MKNKNDTRFTKTSKNGGAELVNRLYLHRAIKRLYDFEVLGLFSLQILELQETVVNLKKRIKELEEW